mgnify:CR=1 FL=1
MLWVCLVEVETDSVRWEVKRSLSGDLVSRCKTENLAGCHCAGASGNCCCSGSAKYASRNVGFSRSEERRVGKECER